MYAGETRYIYFRKNRNRTMAGAISVCYKINEGDTISLAITFCTPGVDRFCRKDARRYIDDRIRTSVGCTIKCEGKAPTYSEMVQATMDLLVKTCEAGLCDKLFGVEFPGWAKQFIRSGFKQDVATKEEIAKALSAKYGNFGVSDDIFVKGTKIPEVIDYILKLAKV